MDQFGEDPDIKLQRASATALIDLKTRLTGLSSGGLPTVKPQKRQNKNLHGKSLDRLLGSINIFQEDPQILDPHLKTLLPPVVDRFLWRISEVNNKLLAENARLELEGLAKILYMFCKVRGEKVISRFLNNEPKYIAPMLRVLHAAKEAGRASAEDKFSNAAWQQRYILLLWLGHLMLTPFPLTSISSSGIHEGHNIINKSFPVPDNLPPVAQEVLFYGLTYVSSAMREQATAAALLVRLAGRPDMKLVGLLDALAKWSLSIFTEPEMQVATVHQYIGHLLTLHRLVTNVDVQDLADYLIPIYKSVTKMVEVGGDQIEHLTTSAVAKKLLIKILRAIVVHALQIQSKSAGWAVSLSNRMLDEMSILEEVIDHLLKGLGERDTPVRLAASKALSMIATKLQPDMAEEVVEAVIGSLNEDIMGSGESVDLSSVNALRWHGLTLTLAHLLFRQVPAATQLPEVLKSLYMALNFEQRSATGSSIGANVRDAANFGLWSLSRRYSTKELQDADVSNIRGAKSAIQLTANELLSSACLDPEGNIRRGSSAALQELIGRHPDTIIEGISLVQAVDYHAVGLRPRAMSSVAFDAACLHQSYRDLLFDGLLGWRGALAGDRNSRVYASAGVRQLSMLPSHQEIFQRVLGIVQKIRELQAREVEERHGYMLALAAVLEERTTQLQDNLLDDPEKVDQSGDLINLLSSFSRMWALFGGPFSISEDNFGPKSIRPALLVEAVLELLTAIGHCSKRMKAVLTADNAPYVTWHLAQVEPPALAALNLCIKYADKDTLDFVPKACQSIIPLLPEEEKIRLVKTWLQVLESHIQSQRNPALKLALGSSWAFLQPISVSEENAVVRERIEKALVRSATSEANIDSRVLAIRSLSLMIPSIKASTLEGKNLLQALTQTFEAGLNDYTTNERGDVGSLVRLETIGAIQLLWKCQTTIQAASELPCYSSMHRLALEKLDKVRLQAGRCLLSIGYSILTSLDTLTDVSTYTYFASLWPGPTTNPTSENLQSIVLGFSITTGGASDSLIPTARSALYDSLDMLPIIPHETTLHTVSLVMVGNAILDIYLKNLPSANDRVLVPLLETTSFLLDTGILQRLSDPGIAFKWRSLLSAVQKSHFKSNNMAKLSAAINVYRGLCEIPQIKAEVMTKLLSMLSHPFPTVRIAVAENLWVITGRDELKSQDWSIAMNELNSVVKTLKASLI